MSEPATDILIADEDPAVRLALAQAFTGLGHRVRCTNNAATVLKWTGGQEARLAIIETANTNDHALAILRDIRRAQPSLPIIMTSAHSTLQTAVSAVEVGAFDYIPKPLDLEAVLSAARRAMTPPSGLEARRAQARAAKDDRLTLIGRSAPMQEVYRRLARLTATDLPVLILGEYGTGKALVAQALHDTGRRRQGPFVGVNLAAMDPAHVEAALLGRDGAAGKLAEADGGTLFLDGVGDLPVDGQTRLLRVLDTLGGARPSNVRIVAAAQPDLQAQAEDGRFRPDLFFRLSVAPLRLPPLRDRPDDLADLARAFLLRAQRDGLPGKAIHGKAIERLTAYAWPGNVRELENLMRRICALYGEDLITAAIVERELTAAPRALARATAPAAPLPDAVSLAVAAYLANPHEGADAGGLYPHMIREVERPMFQAALRATSGNQMRAAEILGINRNTLRRKIDQLGITACMAVGRRR